MHNDIVNKIAHKYILSNIVAQSIVEDVLKSIQVQDKKQDFKPSIKKYDYDYHCDNCYKLVLKNNNHNCCYQSDNSNIFKKYLNPLSGNS
jgi:hypothetical protein